MAVVRDWDGREMAAVTIGPNSQVVYLPTPLKRPEPRAAITASASWEDDDCTCTDPDGTDPDCPEHGEDAA